MRRTILYYPDIEIPDGIWLRQALLFWDEVSSIVPRSYEAELYRSSRAISLLKDTGNFRPIYPDQLMVSGYYRDFEDEVVEKIERYLRTINSSIINSKKSKTNTNKFSNYIHKEKLSSRIMDLLRQEKITKNDNWVHVDDYISDILMTSLSKYSALSDVNYTVIGTDRIRTINKMYPITHLSNPSAPKKPFANLTLRILPTPHLNTPLSTILEFKNKYRDELLAFRKHINKFEEEISNAQSENELKEKIAKNKESIEREVKETIRMLRGSNIDLFLSSIKSVINIKSPTLLSTCAAILGHGQIGLHPAITISGIGVVGTLDISMSYLSIRNTIRDKLSDKGFLYLYYASRKGLVKDLF